MWLNNASKSNLIWGFSSAHFIFGNPTRKQHNGFAAEQIASAINKGIEEMEAIIEGKELELA